MTATPTYCFPGASGLFYRYYTTAPQVGFFRLHADYRLHVYSWLIGTDVLDQTWWTRSGSPDLLQQLVAISSSDCSAVQPRGCDTLVATLPSPLRARWVHLPVYTRTFCFGAILLRISRTALYTHPPRTPLHSAPLPHHRVTRVLNSLAGYTPRTCGLGVIWHTTHTCMVCAGFCILFCWAGRFVPLRWDGPAFPGHTHCCSRGPPPYYWLNCRSGLFRQPFALNPFR